MVFKSIKMIISKFILHERSYYILKKLNEKPTWDHQFLDAILVTAFLKGLIENLILTKTTANKLPI